MSNLQVAVKSHLFLALSPQFVHLSQERDKVAAVTSSGHWDRGEVSAVNRGGRAWHSGERLGNGIVNRGGRAIHRNRGGGSYSKP